MPDQLEADAKARRGVQGIFDRYHKLAQKEPKAHGAPNVRMNRGDLSSVAF